MKKYVFKPYSESFPRFFDKEKERILSHVKKPIAIEHIGSTAIPNLGGKGIIDIAIAVKKNEMEDISTQLQALGYEFRPTFSTADRLYFVIDMPDQEEGERRYHVHLTYPDSADWKSFIGFRDYLRNHPKAMQEYAEIKKQAAAEANHVGERYRKLKEPIFKKWTMQQLHPRKFALIGLPGSGKSTFAARLGAILGISVHHLDRHMFEPDGKKRNKQEFIEVQQAILDEEAWIVEGCSFSTFEMRFAKADVLIYFHFSCLVCFWRLFKRLFNYKRDFGGLRAVTWEILQYTWNFDKEKRAKIEELRQKYPKTEFLLFRSQKDADLFLKSLVQGLQS